MNKSPNPSGGLVSQPLLKWPGGKRALIPSILPLIPYSFRRYYEPFVGGGALFFAIAPENAALADHNADLIECYIEVRDNPEQVVDHLQDMHNTKDDYYRVRAWNPRTSAERAARLIFLVTLAFNGIYRVNLKGNFNVPYGGKTHLATADPDKIRAASAALTGVELRTGDFETSVSEAQEGDLIYFDPPYTVAHSNNGFLKYNARIFSWHDQIRLCDVARSLAAKGCHVIVSNADNGSLLDLYSDFSVKKVTRPSRIAASSEHRRRVTECIFYKGCQE